MTDCNGFTYELTDDEQAEIARMAAEYAERTTQGEDHWQLWPIYLANCPNSRGQQLFISMVRKY